MAVKDDQQQRHAPLGVQLSELAERLKGISRAQEALQELFASVLGREPSLEIVLRQIVAAARELTNARYGALGVFDRERREFVEFVTEGLEDDDEAAAAASPERPRASGLLDHLMADPGPLFVNTVIEHPPAVRLPSGHPREHSMLGVGIGASDRGNRYGNLYVGQRSDGQPFDQRDETMIMTLSGAASLAIDNVLLFTELRSRAEEFQRLLLPQLPDLRPVQAAARYLAASAPDLIGGDWYDAVRLSEDTCAVVVGDIGGHGMEAAATMAQVRSMLRALMFDHHDSPGVVLAKLDDTLQAITDAALSTACLARLERTAAGGSLYWSTAGHPAPLLLAPGEPGRYLQADPGLPLGVAVGEARPNQRDRLPPGATVIFFTDGLIEGRGHSIDEGLSVLAGLATRHADESIERLCDVLIEGRPGDNSDDVAILALRLPA
jgi:hypothetical protein